MVQTPLQWAFDTQSGMTTPNRIPLDDEICWEKDTGWFKRGDGVTAYASLPYAGAIKQRDLPSYAPPILLHTWDPRTASYNLTSNMHAFRADVKHVQGGSTDMHCLFIGDSTLTGFNGSGWTYDKSIPRMFARSLSHLLGDVPWTGGIQPAVAQQAWFYDNTAVTGSFTAGYAAATSSGAAVGTYKWTSLDPVTSISFVVDNRSTSSFVYQIDGGTGVGVTTDGTTTMKVVNVTGLTKGIHNVLISATAAQTVIVYGFRGWDPAVKSIHLHNIAYGGATANTPATPGKNFSSTQTTLGAQGLGWVLPNLLTAFGITPDIQLIGLGSNDINASTSPANTITGLQTVKGYNSTVPTMFIHSPQFPGSNLSNFEDYSGRWFTMLDGFDCPGFDWEYWDGRVANYVSEMSGTDGIHPSFDEMAGVARHIALVLTQADYQGPADPVVATFSKSGALTVTTGTQRWYNDSGRTLKITAIRASVGTAPTGAALIVDVKIAGTTIYTTSGNRPTIAVSTNTIKSTNPDIAVIPDGTYFTVDVAQIGSTVAGSDLTVAINMV